MNNYGRICLNEGLMLKGIVEMSIKSKIAVAYTGIILIILYFFVVAGYFITESALAFKCWELMIMISAPILLVILIVILENADENKKGFKIASLVFMTGTTVITSVAHYSNIISNKNVTVQFQPNDSLAWGYFLGLAFIFASISLPSELTRLKKIKYTILVCGCLCLLGLLGPITHIDALWFIAVVGYGLGTPIICVQLIKFYK
jgi:hypothetical protein